MPSESSEGIACRSSQEQDPSPTSLSETSSLATLVVFMSQKEVELSVSFGQFCVDYSFQNCLQSISASSYRESLDWNGQALS